MKRALLIIDVQKGMFNHMQPYQGAAVVQRLANTLSKARASMTPIFFIQHDGGATSPLARGTENFEIVDDLTPSFDETVIVKQHCSAFQGTDLIDQLRAAQVDEIIIGGMQSEYCVDTAVRGAFERGFAVTLLADGHTTFDTPALPAEQIIAHHNHTLESGNFAKVTNSRDVLTI